MRIKNQIISLVLILLCEVSADVTLPSADFSEEWRKASSLQQYTQSNLFDYINGGADLFLEFGFEKLLVQKYSNQENQISLEVYQMENPEAALGIYLTKKGASETLSEISARNSGNRYQYTIVKHRYFILVNNFSGNESLQPHMITISRKLLHSIPESQPVTLLQQLPKNNLVEGTELIFRGPYALQPIYTFGQGDILQLNGDVFGIGGDYSDEMGNVYTRLIIPYPSHAAARSTLINLIDNLDSYLTIIQQWDTGFIFKDYRKKFGIVNLSSKILDIKINLPKEPLRPVGGE